MADFEVKLNSICDVKEFVNHANKCSFEVDLISGKYAVDGKSIMGIFSLDLSKNLVMRVNSENEESKEFLEEVAKFIVD